MPLQKLSFRPGVNTQLSKTANEGGWSASQLVRFRDGLPEKWRGWITQCPTPVIGNGRAVWTWQQLDGTLDAAAGTSSHLHLFNNGTLYDITPYRAVRAVTNPFATTNGSPDVTVTDVGHGANAGDIVSVPSVSVGGLALAGQYTVTNPVTTNTYVIVANANATSTATGGGSINLSYLLPYGEPNASVGYGAGSGPVGNGTVGTPRPASSAIAMLPAQWTLANWGEVLLACPRGGTLYNWLPTNGTSTVASAVTNATPSDGPPLVIAAMLIGMPERHCILLGTSDLGASTNFNPMQVRFSNVEDYTTWNATQTNSAGSFILQGGTRLVGGLNTVQQTLLWSDNCLFSMRYIGGDLVYGFDRISSGCGLVGPHAMIEFDGTVYWMSPSAFFMYQGAAPQEMPCTIWETVFRNLNSKQADKVVCGLNTAANSIIWFYPSANSLECDSYAEWNFFDQVWDYGLLGRCGWADSSIFQAPVAIGTDGYLYLHEMGVDASGLAMQTSLTSGFMDIGDGTDFSFIDRIVPDFDNQSGNVYITMQMTDYPNAAPRTYGPYTLSEATNWVNTRARGRQVAFTISTQDIGADFRLGAMRINIAPDGRR